MVALSKVLLAGVVGAGFAGTAALISGNDPRTAAYGDWLQAGNADTSFQSSRARAGSDNDMAPETALWYYYSQQNRPACPASGCTMDALFHLAH
jgi:hypothetical protein